MVHRIALTALLAASATDAFISGPLNKHASLTRYHCAHSAVRCVQSTACAATSSSNVEEESVDIPSFVVSPVLAQVYPALVAHKANFGNPNIPLGSTDGKRCNTLRRLHFQHKLTEEEANLLLDIGFRFHSFEDVYYENDFDEMLSKLLEYRDEFQTYQIPKKYEPDPESSGEIRCCWI